MQWYANSISLRKPELEHFQNVNGNDLAAVCETKLISRRKFTVPDYSIYRSDRNKHGGEALLLIHNDLSHGRVNKSVNSKMETIAVIVHSTQYKRLLIVSRYNPPNNTLSCNDLEALFAANVPTDLLGDFNSKHIAWHCETIDRNGTILLQYVPLV
jgi:hypothetical protein